MTPRPIAFWIKLYDGVHENVKVKRAARRLKISVVAMVGHLTSLWLWTMKHRPSGALTGLEPDEIADAARWTDDPEVFFVACRDIGLLTERTIYGRRVLEVNDWDAFVRQTPTTKLSRRKPPSSPTEQPAAQPAEKPRDAAIESPRRREEIRVDRGERENTTRRKRRRSPTVSADATKLVERYVQHTDMPASAAAYRNAQRRIDNGELDDMTRAVDNYLSLDTDPDYHIATHNFFGKAERYKEHLTRRKKKRPRRHPDAAPSLRETWGQGNDDPKTDEERLRAWRLTRQGPLARALMANGTEPDYRPALSLAFATLERWDFIPSDDPELDAPADWEASHSMLNRAKVLRVERSK